MNEPLRRALLRARLREEDVAARIGVDPKTVRRWLSGRVPYPQSRAAIADLVGVDEAELWPDAGGQSAAKMRPDELCVVYPHRWAIPREVWTQFFGSAEHEIGILAYSALFLAEDEGVLRILAAKSRESVRVRIVLGNPDSRNVAERGEEEGIGEGMSAKVRNALALFRPLAEAEDVEIRLHSAVLYNSIYRADDRLLVNQHAYGTPAARSPVFGLNRAGAGDMADAYFRSFERIWDGALPFRDPGEAAGSCLPGLRAQPWEARSTGRLRTRCSHAIADLSPKGSYNPSGRVSSDHKECRRWRRAGGVPVRYVVLPMPVIEWTVVVKADDPTREATRGRLRELRRKRRVLGGLTIWRRGPRGLQGRSTYYSVLAALAARSWQEGHDVEAAGLEQAAAQLENQFSARLETFLSSHNLSQLPQAEFFEELTAATARSLASWSRVFQTLLAAARVDEIEDDIAHLEGSSPRGGQVSVDLPRALLERQSLKTGDLVWVFSRVVGDAALVELLPATRVVMEADIPNDVPSGLMALAGVQPDASRLGVGSDGLTDEERAEYAQRFNATVGADLSADDLTQLMADAATEQIPRRRLRPAG